MDDTQSKRADLVRILQAVCPEADFSDDEVLFGRIIDDYADYAQLLEQHEQEVREAELRGRNASIEQMMHDPEPASDGTPHLCGGSDGWASKSLFDMALEM